MLELHHDGKFQQHEWLWQRVGWGVCGMFLLAGGLGFLGAGPFGRAVARSADERLQVSYQRYAHVHAPAVMTFHVHRRADARDKFELVLSQTYWDAIQVRAIQPEPVRTVAEDGGMRLEFDAEPDVRRLSVKIEFEFAEAGCVQGWARAEQSVPVAFSQCVYP